MLILGTCKAKDPVVVVTDSLLLHFNGVDEATTTTDSSENNFTITANGTVALDTAQKKFGSASSYHAGGENYWSVASSTKFGFGAGEFTIEAWVRVPSVVADWSRIISFWGFFDFWVGLRDGNIAFGDEYNYCGVGSGTVISTDTWTHIAVTKTAGVLYGFLGGVKQWDRTCNENLNDESEVYIGSESTGVPFAGHIDEVKIRKECLYTADFTPPTSEY
jgi:hypothetical protein